MKPEIKKYQFKDGLPTSFQIINISELYRQNKAIIVSPHRVNFYHIIFIQGGSPVHTVDFNSISLNPNSILFVPKDCVHSFDSSDEYEGKVILFTDDFFSKNPDDYKFLHGSILYNDLYGTTHFNINPTTSEVPNIISLLESESSKSFDHVQADVLRNLLHILLLISEREKYKQGFTKFKASADLDYFLLFKDLVDKNFKTEKLVSKYVSDLGITESRLNKATTQLLDKTPKELIDEKVILEAKRLLAHFNKSVKEIAYELGFSEPTNFIKYFRKHTSKTPIEFREKYNNYLS